MQLNNNHGITTQSYAEFWERLVALVIDSIIISAITSSIILVFFGSMLGRFFSLISIEMSGAANSSTYLNGEMAPLIDEGFSSFLGLMLNFVGSFLLVFIAIILINYLYYTLMDSSKFQGTLGKMIVRIKVVDDRGNQINFSRATGRYFVRTLLSGILFIGYIIAIFSDKRQTLHDLLANTVVLKR